jgi:hypothetical protein
VSTRAWGYALMEPDGQVHTILRRASPAIPSGSPAVVVAVARIAPHSPGDPLRYDEQTRMVVVDERSRAQYARAAEMDAAARGNEERTRMTALHTAATGEDKDAIAAEMRRRGYPVPGDRPLGG